MINFEKTILDNGLTVISHKDSSTPFVTLNILYKVGARNEKPQQTGFAHLFEHLMFGGSVNIPNYDKPVQFSGGKNNAFTTNDITNYYVNVPKINIETAFWLESDRMLQLDFSTESLNVQKHVVVEEFKQQYLNRPYGDIWLLLRPLIYKKHPYRWATIGKDISHIKNATLEDVKNFFYRFYAPNNAIAVVSGDIEHDKVKQLSQKWFGGIERRDIETKCLPIEPPQIEARVLEVERDVPNDALYKAYRMCDRLSADYHVVDLLSDMLSNGNSSRLYQELVKKQKKFLSIDAFISGSVDDGLLLVFGKLNKGVKMEDAENSLLIELDKIKTELCSDYELLKVKNKLETTLIFKEVSPLNKAINLAYYEFLRDAEDANTEFLKYKNIQKEDIKRVANKILIPENCSTLYYRAKNK